MKGFIPWKYPGGEPTPWEYMTVGDGTYEVGDALTCTSGVLELASGTTAPSYICMFDGKLTSNTSGKPVIRVDKDVIYQTELSTASSSLTIGTKYTIAATSDSITATDTSGIAEVVAFDGKAKGDTVYVRF